VIAGGAGVWREKEKELSKGRMPGARFGQPPNFAPAAEAIQRKDPRSQIIFPPLLRLPGTQ
jgi:hypothetical protein